MPEEKILTRHPLGKSGRNISKRTYDLFKRAILSALRGTELTHEELLRKVDEAVAKGFEGNASWYGETVKLDLEARRLIERTSSRPQKYRLRQRRDVRRGG